MPRHRFSRFFPLVFIVADLICLNTSYFLANWINFEYLDISNNSFLVVQAAANIIWIVVFYSARLQNVDRESSLSDQFNRWFSSYIVNISIVFALWILATPLFYSKHQLFYTYLIFPALSLSWRYLWNVFISYVRALGYNSRKVVVAGLDEMSEQLVGYFRSSPQLGYHFYGFFDNRKEEGDKVKGTLKDIRDYVRRHDVDVIYCNIARLTKKQATELIEFAENHFIKISLISNIGQFSHRHAPIYHYGDISVVNLSAIPLDEKINQIMKRLFDIVFSGLVMLFILSWVIPIFGLLIKLDSEGPVFFRQRRNGLYNRPFRIYKFRSMKVHYDTDVKQATKGDPRITKLGAFLRKSSIDELPQFINVFLGDMSVVGPRPHAIKHNMEFKKLIDRFIQRHAVKPGITGLAQARGYRGETNTFEAINGRVRLDRFYVRNWSIFFDFKIIFWTVVSMFRGNQNAY